MLIRRYLPALVTVVFLAVWFLLFRPTFLGGPASYIIVSGISMEPTLYTGDLAVLHKQDSYAPGDIVAFRAAGSGMVIHRIIGDSAEEGYLIQGDNKAEPDPWHPTPDDVLGKMWLQLPRAGNLFHMLREPLNLGLLVGGLILATFTGAVAGLSLSGSSESRERRRRLRKQIAQRRESPASWLS